MKRPPFLRRKSKTRTAGSNPAKGSGRNIRSGLRRFRGVLIFLVAISALQFATQGKVSWPANVVHKITATITSYAGRPDAGWKRATKSLEEIGAAREGQPIPEFDLTGRVVRVADGDTVSVLDKTKTQHKIRLYGIDTPERDQPHGKIAKKALADFVAGKNVGVVLIETDSYGRGVGTLYLEDTNINLAMVAGGHAWWYRHYAPHNRLLQATETAARNESLGLWAAPDPVPPWDWRRGRR